MVWSISALFTSISSWFSGKKVTIEAEATGPPRFFLTPGPGCTPETHHRLLFDVECGGRDVTLTTIEPLPRTSHHLALVGDSLLDNIIWVQEELKDTGVKPKDVADWTTEFLQMHQPGSKATNLAVDETKLEDLFCKTPASKYVKAHITQRKPYPMEEGKVNIKKLLTDTDPPEEIKQLDLKLEEVDTIAVSVGGNDVYLSQKYNLRNMLGTPSLLAEFLTSKDKGCFADLKKRYIAAVGELKAIKPRVILVSILNPAKEFVTMNDTKPMGMAIVGLMVDVWCAHVIQEAATKFKLPVADLRIVFNPHLDGKGTDGINLFKNKMTIANVEPSMEGGRRLGKVLAHITTHHNWNGEPRYYGLEETGDEVVAWEGACPSVYQSWRGELGEFNVTRIAPGLKAALETLRSLKTKT